MTSNAFLAGVENVCIAHKIQISDLVKIAVAVNRQAEVPPQAPMLSNLTNMATGAAPAQIQHEGITNLLQSINDLGRYNRPLQPRQPFSN